jgi:hypothetical protein
MTKNTDSGIKDASNIGTEAPAVATIPVSPAGREIAMLLALQKKEWQELRSTPGVVLKYINLQEPTSKRNVLLVAIGTMEDDIIGNNSTLDVSVNGMGIDAIVEQVISENGIK